LNETKALLVNGGKLPFGKFELPHP